MKTRNVQIRTNSGFEKTVTSTGDSPMVEVLEHLKLYGNENHLSGKQKDYEAMLAKYGYTIKKPRIRHAALTNKPKPKPLTNEECEALLRMNT